MKKTDILLLHSQLTRTDFNSICNSVFQYAVQKNINKLEPEVKTIQKAIEGTKSARFKELEQIMLPMYERAIAGKSEHEYAAAEAGILKEWEHAAEWVAEKKRFEGAVNELLETESDYELYSIKLSTLEPLSLNQMQMRAVMRLVVE